MLKDTLLKTPMLCYVINVRFSFLDDNNYYIHFLEIFHGINTPSLLSVIVILGATSKQKWRYKANLVATSNQKWRYKASAV